MANPSEQEVADALARGLAGFMQWMFMREAEGLLNELRLQVEAVGILVAKYGKRVEVGKRPTNWPKKCKEKIDLAVLEKKSWSMIGEVKYFTKKEEFANGREDTLQDVSRLACAKVARGAPRLLIVCCHNRAKDCLWAKVGNEGGNKQRAIALAIPKRKGSENSKTAMEKVIFDELGSWQKRTPKPVRLKPTDKVRVTLLSDSEFSQGGHCGIVRVWKVEPA